MQFVNMILDWKRQWFQALILVTIIILNICVDVPKWITSWIAQGSIGFESLKIEWQILIRIGRWGIFLAMFFFVLSKIRKANADVVIRQTAHAIVWHSYFGYCCCRYILGYKTLSLIRVPISKQFQIVCHNLFDVDKKELQEIAKKDEDDVKVSYYNNSFYSSEIVLILSDTYQLDRDKIDIDGLKNLKTVVIDRSSDDHTRYYSPEFISAINNEIHHLPSNVETIHLFATMNPSNCYHAASEVFMTGGRDSWKHLHVYEQNKDTWKFDGKKRVKVF